ncbi:MAG: hypothetical protein P0S96_04225 [Simkaniaceae bacterium]|nr:hypothetical protein [Candidatus Sacchlamyda saccharinae]
MEILKEFFFKIIAPIIYLFFFAYAYAVGFIQLSKAWKKKNFVRIWLYTWGILVTTYFLIYGGK